MGDESDKYAADGPVYPFRVLMPSEKYYWYKREWLLKKQDPSYTGSDVASIFSCGFLWFGIAFLCWLTDMLACGILQRVPFGMLLNFHGLGWHLCSCLGAYHLFVIVLYHQHVISEQLRAKISWTGFH